MEKDQPIREKQDDNSPGGNINHVKDDVETLDNDKLKKAKKKKSHKTTAVVQELEIIEDEVEHVVDAWKNHKKQLRVCCVTLQQTIKTAHHLHHAIKLAQFLRVVNYISNLLKWFI